MSDVQVIAFLSTAHEVPAVSAEAALPSEIVWMPVGVHSICAGRLDSEDSYAGRVICDEQGASRIIADFAKMKAAQVRCFLDFDHEEREASADVTAFKWDPARGIVASVRWTGSGEEALRKRDYASFSPAFLLDMETGKLRGLIAGHAIGGLVNRPAFGTAMPLLIAARLGGKSLASPASDGTSATHHQASSQIMDTNTQSGAAATVAAAPVQNSNDADLRAILAAQSDQIKALMDAVKANQQEKASAPVVAAAIVRPSVNEAAPVKASEGPIEALRLMASERDPHKRGAMYRNVRPMLAKERNVMGILAANSLGTLSTDLVTLRALDLLKFRFPALFKLSTDFSSDAAYFGQTVKTRLITPPAISTYSTTTGYSKSDVAVTDATVVINQHKAVEIGFNVNELASTARDLFGEQVEACHYTLGKDLFDSVLALITAANYTNATTKATSSVARATLVAMEKALTTRKIPELNRIMLANPDVWEVLANDATIVSLATFQKPEVITDAAYLPNIAGFEMFRAPTLPSTGNLTGFACTPAAIAIATRTVSDYTKVLPGVSSGDGVVGIVVNPDVGLSVTKVDYINHQMGQASSRLAWMYGVAVGVADCGQRLISA